MKRNYSQNKYCFLTIEVEIGFYIKILKNNEHKSVWIYEQTIFLIIANSYDKRATKNSPHLDRVHVYQMLL